jgi:hypothetical protein
MRRVPPGVMLVYNGILQTDCLRARQPYYRCRASPPLTLTIKQTMSLRAGPGHYIRGSYQWRASEAADPDHVRPESH